MPNSALYLRFPADWRARIDDARGDNDLGWFVRELILDRIGRDGVSPNFTHGQGGGSPSHRPKKAARKKVGGKRK